MSEGSVRIEINDLLKVQRAVVGLSADEAEYQNILLVGIDEEVIILDPSGANEGRNVFVRVVITGEEGYLPRYCLDPSLPIPGAQSEGEKALLLVSDEKVTDEGPTPKAAFSSHVPEASESAVASSPIAPSQATAQVIQMTVGEGEWNPVGRVSADAQQRMSVANVSSQPVRPASSNNATGLMDQYRNLDWEGRRPYIRAKRKGNMHGCFTICSGPCGDLWPEDLIETPLVAMGFFLLILANFAFTIGAVMTDSLTQAQISGLVVNTTEASILMRESDGDLTLDMALNITGTGDDVLANISYNIQCGWKSAIVTYEEFDPYTKDYTRITKDSLRPKSKRIQYGKKEDLCDYYWNSSNFESTSNDDDETKTDIVFCFDMSDDDSDMVQSEGTVWLYSLFISVPALFLSFCFISTEAGPCIFVVSILVGLSMQMVAFINWDSNPAAKDCWEHVSLLEYTLEPSESSTTINALYLDIDNDWSFVGLSQMMIIVTMTILCIACCMLCTANTSAREQWKERWHYGSSKNKRSQWADAHVFDPFVDGFDYLFCSPTPESDGVCLNCGVNFDASWFICLFVCCLVCDDECEILDCEGGC